MKKKLLLLFAVLAMAINASAENYILYTSEDGNIVTPNKTDVFGANIISNTYEEGLGKIVFDGEVTSIGDYAFALCSSLTSVKIPNSVISIGEGAFRECWIVTSIDIPNSVTSIGDYAFGICVSLTSVDIPNSVTSIGEKAFYNCWSLTSVVIPNSVTSIGERAFEECKGLTSVVIGNSITSIAHGMFSDCSSLTSVEIPNSVIWIDSQAFSRCSSLTSVKIPNTVTEIALFAFEYCSSLTSVEIPNSVTEIGDCVFSHCSSLTSFTGKFASEDNRCLIAHGRLNSFAPAGLTSYSIPNSVGSIGLNAFADCSNLISVVIPNSVTSIDFAFARCSNLIEITSLNPTPPYIGSSTFSGVDKNHCVVRVPDEAVNDYKSADYWKQFFNIVGITTTGISTPSANALRMGGKAYNLSGTEANDSYRGIVIKNGKKILRK